jgi:hypothetical protein
MNTKYNTEANPNGKQYRLGYEHGFNEAVASGKAAPEEAIAPTATTQAGYFVPKITARPVSPTEDLLEALSRARLKHGRVETLLYLIDIDGAACVGVFGDPCNYNYEWFVWRDGILSHSDENYGGPCIALLDVLKQEVLE